MKKVKQYIAVSDRVGHVFKWEHGSIRKIYSGFRSPFDESIMWHHMPCEKAGDKHVIQGPTHVECGAFCYYWITEERATNSEIVSREEITDEDKVQLALPVGPPCDWCAEHRTSGRFQ